MAEHRRAGGSHERNVDTCLSLSDDGTFAVFYIYYEWIG